MGIKGETDMKIENGKTIYESFAELPVDKKHKEEKPKKLKKRQDKFVGICRWCGSRLAYIPDTNVCCCINPECEGNPKKKKRKDPNKQELPTATYFRCLDKRGTDIAKYLFKEGEQT